MLCYSTTAVVFPITPFYSTVKRESSGTIFLHWNNTTFPCILIKKGSMLLWTSKIVVFQIILLVKVHLKCPVTDFLQQFNVIYPCKHALYALKASYFCIVVHVITLSDLQRQACIVSLSATLFFFSLIE